MITGLDHVALTVRDLDAATEAYARLLGRRPAWTGEGGAWFQFPNMALSLERGETEGLSALAFVVPDLEAARRLAARRGLSPAEPQALAGDGPLSRPLSALSVETTAGVQLGLARAATGGLPAPLSPPTAEEAAGVYALDHVVVQTPNADRALATFGAKLGLDLRLDRTNPDWGSRLLFFRCGDAVVEIGARLNGGEASAPDRFGGLAWRVRDPVAAQARIAAAGLDVSEVRKGRKPGTAVFTVRSGAPATPALIIQPSAQTGAGDDD